MDGRHFSSVHSTELSPAPARPGTGIDAAMDLARIDEHGHRLATSTTHPEHGPPAGHRLLMWENPISTRTRTLGGLDPHPRACGAKDARPSRRLSISPAPARVWGEGIDHHKTLASGSRTRARVGRR